ncbi:membrane protein [Gordonia phage Guey18]|nr:membrane protein [Gordonia phage Guey18]
MINEIQRTAKLFTPDPFVYVFGVIMGFAFGAIPAVLAGSLIDHWTENTLAANIAAFSIWGIAVTVGTLRLAWNDGKDYRDESR